MDLISGIHDSLSLHMLLPFSRLQRLTRPATRPTQQAFNDGVRFRREAANWDDDRQRKWILDRLRSVVRNAFEQTDFYRERLKACNFDPYADFDFNDFSHLPVLTRE